MATGKVKWFSDAKGYGFIQPDEAEAATEVFVHYSGITREGFRTLLAGQRVQYELVETEKGCQAQNVDLVV